MPEIVHLDLRPEPIEWQELDSNPFLFELYLRQLHKAEGRLGSDGFCSAEEVLEWANKRKLSRSA